MTARHSVLPAGTAERQQVCEPTNPEVVHRASWPARIIESWWALRLIPEDPRRTKAIVAHLIGAHRISADVDIKDEADKTVLIKAVPYFECARVAATTIALDAKHPE
jgi:hypothetical protein